MVSKHDSEQVQSAVEESMPELAMTFATRPRRRYIAEPRQSTAPFILPTLEPDVGLCCSIGEACFAMGTEGLSCVHSLSKP